MEIYCQETFQDTIQGEGAQVGRPCDFIRLYGCPVGCYFCDTGYGFPDGDWYKNKIPRIKKTFEELKKEFKSDFVVISGGEPFIHKNLPELCQMILDDNRDCSIETSGSYWQDVPEDVYITLSPKEHLNPKYPVKDIFWNRCDEVKIVISKGDEIDFYRKRIPDDVWVYLQPEYDDFKNTITKTLELLKKNQDFKLSLQTHKVINVR